MRARNLVVALVALLALLGGQRRPPPSRCCGAPGPAPLILEMAVATWACQLSGVARSPWRRNRPAPGG
jgi:hypothetical protein